MTACTSANKRPTIEQTPASRAQAYVDLGLGYLQQNQLERALERLDKALIIDPENTAAQHYIAETYHRLGRAAEAAIHFERAINRAGQDPMLRNNYGAFLCTQGKLDEAVVQFLAAARHPNYASSAQAYENAGVCLMREEANADRRVQADGHLRSALQMDPTLPRALYYMARLQFADQRPLLARGYLQRYTEVAAPTAQSLHLGAQIEAALGNLKGAQDYRKQIRQRFPDSHESREPHAKAQGD